MWQQCGKPTVYFNFVRLTEEVEEPVPEVVDPGGLRDEVDLVGDVAEVEEGDRGLRVPLGVGDLRVAAEVPGVRVARELHAKSDVQSRQFDLAPHSLQTHDGKIGVRVSEVVEEVRHVVDDGEQGVAGLVDQRVESGVSERLHPTLLPRGRPEELDAGAEQVADHLGALDRVELAAAEGGPKLERRN